MIQLFQKKGQRFIPKGILFTAFLCPLVLPQAALALPQATLTITGASSAVLRQCFYLWDDRPDLYAHLFGSYALSFTISEVLVAPPFELKPLSQGVSLGIGIGFTLGLGLFKEFVIDQRPDQSDMMADVLGTVLGGLMFTLLEFR